MATVESMTGYGRGEGQHPGGSVVVELRTLNSKGFDFPMLRMPSRYRALDPEIRKRVKEAVRRGKVECAITSTWLEGRQPISVNLDATLLGGGFSQLQTTLSALGVTVSNDALLSALLRREELWQEREVEAAEEELSALMLALDDALVELCRFRATEGASTAADLLEKLSGIEQFAREVDSLKDERIEAVRERMKEGIAQLQEKEGIEVDSQRVAQELIFHIERLDINEELQRLAQHCAYFRETLAGDEAPGRKLNFISQELGREINTIGSKANHAGIQRLVVQMKDNLEKIKEQTLNLL